LTTQRDHTPSSPAAPLRESDIGLLAPDDEDEGRFALPQVRIAGFKLTSIVILCVVVGGAFFALRAIINFSTDEVTRSKTEFHEAFGR
jgi:hypothetical protein